MENKDFLHAYSLINKSLFQLKMDRTFNSIGSNVFFEFGKEKELIHKNGRKYTKKEWSIWLSHTSWRIMKHNRYLFGSGESLDVNLQSKLQALLNKRFQSFRFLSQFLDAEFNFEDGYQITTFFNWAEENQWTIFLPDDSNIGVDCSSAEGIKNVQAISQHFKIEENYEKVDSPLQATSVTNIAFNERNMPIIHFENDSSIHLEACAWRLEKKGNYLVGCLDDDQKKIQDELTHLIGKKLHQIDLASAMMDARFQFEGGFVLKTFSCCSVTNQWKICVNKEPIFYAKIPLLDDDQAIQ